MTIDTKDLLNSILASLSRIDYIRPEDLPDIDLYMDQVTTFMDSHLAPTKRHKEDKILTKTMINNYAKNNLLPPPQKKKYSKGHMLTLIFIYYFKNILCINDIQSILNPITDKYFEKNASLSLEDIYNRIFELEQGEIERVKEIIRQKFIISESAFQDLEGLDEEESDFLQKFTFICLLSFDVYVKKLLIEKLIDSMKQPDPPKGRKHNK